MTNIIETLEPYEWMAEMHVPGYGRCCITFYVEEYCPGVLNDLPGKCYEPSGGFAEVKTMVIMAGEARIPLDLSHMVAAEQDRIEDIVYAAYEKAQNKGAA